MKSSPLVRFMFFLTTVLIAGCGSGDGNTMVVEGTVTANGEPVKSGHIDFIPTDGLGQTTGAEIKDGKYSAKVPPGPKRVNVTADKVVGQKKVYPNDPNSTVVDDIVQYIPERYNAKSELTYEVMKGKNTKDFELKLDK